MEKEELIGKKATISSSDRIYTITEFSSSSLFNYKLEHSTDVIWVKRYQFTVLETN
jgi:hypothetical protein